MFCALGLVMQAMLPGTCVASPPPVAPSHIEMGALQKVARVAGHRQAANLAGMDVTFGPSLRRDSSGAPALTNRSGSRVVESAQPNAVGAAGIQVTMASAGFTDYYDGCTERPCVPAPNPAVAVSATQLIHAVDGYVEIRQFGTRMMTSESVAEFFGDPALPAPDPGRYVDPNLNPSRVAWDQTRGRWYASAMRRSISGDGYVLLAVSESSDAFGAWSIYRFAIGYGDQTRADLGVTQDKVLLAWSTGCWEAGSCSASLPPARTIVIDSDDLTAIPDQLPSATIDLPDSIPYVVQNVGQANALVISATPSTFMIAPPAPARTPAIINLTTIKGGVGVGTSASSAVIAVRDYYFPPASAPEGIMQATWAGGHIWLVGASDCAADPNRLCTRADKVNVGDPAHPQVVDSLDVPTGEVYWAAGAASADGTMYLTYGVPTDSGYVQYATAHLPTDPAGSYRTPTVLLRDDASVSSSSRSQMYQFAQDPRDPRAIWVGLEKATSDGGWVTVIARLTAGKTGSLTGTATINDGRQDTVFLQTGLDFAPASNAPVVAVRVSNSPTMTPYAEGPTPWHWNWQLDDLDYGGSKATGPRNVYVQWGDGAGSWSPVTTATVSVDPSVPVTRLAGPDRYATAAAITRAGFAPGVEKVFIATGLNFPDALAGAAVAARDGAPMLFVDQLGIPPATVDELNRLKPKSIVILGSAGVVSASIETQLHSFTSGAVTRQFGADRFETAADVATKNFRPGVNCVFATYAFNFPDALAAAPVAGSMGCPIVFVTADGVPAPTQHALSALKPQYIYLLGSSGLIPDAVMATLKNTAPTYRVWGNDRYETAVALSRMFGPGQDQVFIATGVNFPDALAGAPLGGWYGGPILYCSQLSTLPAVSATEIKRLAPKQAFLFGSAAVVPNGIATEVRGYLAP